METDVVEIGPCLIKTDSDGKPLPGFLCSNCKESLSKVNYRGDPVLVCLKCNATLDYPDVHAALIEYMSKMKKA